MPLLLKDFLQMRKFRICVWIKDIIFLISEDWSKKMVILPGYNTHIKSRGEENIRIEIPCFRARKWVVERAHSWLNRFIRLLIRWEKKIENYLAMLHFACA